MTCDARAQSLLRERRERKIRPVSLYIYIYGGWARGVSRRNKRIVEDYYARTQSRYGCTLVCAQRIEQTISPTLCGRTRTTVLSRMCVCVCTYVLSAKLLQRQRWPGNVCNIRGVRIHACVCVCVSLIPTTTGYVRLQTASVQRIFRRRVVVGPGRILRLARSLNPPGSLSAFSSLPRPTLLPSLSRLGSKAKASPLLHLHRWKRPCNSNETLPVPVYPGSRLRARR